MQLTRQIHYDELVQAPHWLKVEWAEKRIEEFLVYVAKDYETKNTPLEERKVLVSFSGGKDSTVLLDLVLKVHHKIQSNLYVLPAYAFEITFPETIKFIKSTISFYQERYGDKVLDLYLNKPKDSWHNILNKHGYPIFSKQVSVLLNRIVRVKSKNGLTRWVFGINTTRYKISKNRIFLLDKKMKAFPYDDSINYDYFGPTYFNDDYFFSEKCCDFIKGGLKHYKIPTFVGTTTSESYLRKKSWIKEGCNILSSKRLLSRPISIWKTYDIWRYILDNQLTYNQKYGEINPQTYTSSKYQRLGCISCPYGSHLEQKENDMNPIKNRFEILLLESPQLYKAQVIDNGMYKILIDMGIKIRDDAEYMHLYELRWNQINAWNYSFGKHLADVLTQIENYQNYKNYPSTNKMPDPAWTYTDKELIQIKDNYDVDVDNEKFLEWIIKNRELRKRGN